MIRDETGIPVDQSQIFFAPGQLLEDAKTMEYYQIQNGDVLHNVLKLGGC